MNTTPAQPSSPASGLGPTAVEALLLDTTPYLSCDDCFARMDTYVEALLRDDGHRDLAMERHLRGCAACDEEAQAMVTLLTDSA